MLTYDLLHKTRNKEPLTTEEIRFLVEGFTKGDIPDYMMSAWMMAVCCQGLTDRETVDLTLAMRDSGDCLDLSPIGAVTVDKHSTGGIGDKTTLLLAPIVAACGGHVPKMSGRGLGFTGGTIDKLESIPGFRTNLTLPEFYENTSKIGCCIIAQSGDLTPADKKMYALRNLTATVESIPLICASIMSKKLALGADCILLDVKYGSGAFMKTQREAAALARCMVRVGKQAGRSCRAVITDMNAPLGYAVGNALEVAEVIQILRGDFDNRLADLAVTLSANMMQLSGMGTLVKCWSKAEKALRSGAALEKLREMIAAQGGDAKVCDDLSRLPQARESRVITAKATGYITRIQSEEIGLACLTLGAGRTADSPAIDPGAGVVFRAAVGDPISRGDEICTVYGAKPAQLDEACERIEAALSIEDIPAPKIPLVSKLVR